MEEPRLAGLSCAAANDRPPVLSPAPVAFLYETRAVAVEPMGGSPHCRGPELREKFVLRAFRIPSGQTIVRRAAHAFFLAGSGPSRAVGVY